MSIEIKPVDPNHVYWVATSNDLTVVHYGLTEHGMVTTTGQPNLETFDNEADYLARLTELGVTPEEE